MTQNCHLKEPSVPFQVVHSIQITYEDGTTEAVAAGLASTDPLAPASALLNMVIVDSQLLTKDAFNAKYDVDGQTTPLA